MFTLSKTWLLALFSLVSVFELFSGYLNILVARRLGKLLVLEIAGPFWVEGAVADVLLAAGVGCLVLPAGFGCK